MTDSLRLHYAPDNASLCVRLALETCGLPYETALVDRAVSAQKSPAYLALNPMGLIPVLETPDGVISETAAILLWVSERCPELLAAPGTPQRATELKWLIWLSNSLHAAERILFYPDQHIAQHATEALRRRTRERIAEMLAILNVAPDADWLETGTGILNCYLGPLLRWPALYGGDTGWYVLENWPRLFQFALRFEQTQPALRVAEAEGLGPTIFSAPVPPNPPEGSAT